MSGYDGVDSGWESADSEAIRLRACDVAADDVCHRLNNLGIRYVLKLGESSEWSASIFPDYVEATWLVLSPSKMIPRVFQLSLLRKYETL